MRRSYILSFLVVAVCAQPTMEAPLAPVSLSGVMGKVVFIGYPDRVEVRGTISGLTPGAHGFHIHEIGDCGGQGAVAAGGHFNPSEQLHGRPSVHSHMGDLGNIKANDQGVAVINKNLTMLAQDDLIALEGRSVIVHAAPDDFFSQPTGDSGTRVACGVIQ